MAKELSVFATNEDGSIGYVSLTLLVDKEEVCTELGFNFKDEDFEETKVFTSASLKDLNTKQFYLSMFIQDIFNAMPEPVDTVSITVKHKEPQSNPAI